MKIVISSGHGKYVRGASGSPVPPQLDEVDEARKVVERVAEFWRSIGFEVQTFHDNTSHDQNTNLNTIVNYHNSHLQPHDLDVSIHFNAYDGSAHGVECLYITQQTLAKRVADQVAALGFTNRGPKKRTDLFFLNNTEEPAILVETCFCDNTPDSNLYRSRFDDVCRAIAEAVAGQQIGEPEEPEPPEPIPPPVGSDWPLYGEVSGLTTGDRLNIRSQPMSGSDIIGDCGNNSVVKAVGQSNDKHWYKLEFGAGILVYGWASSDYIVLEAEPPVSVDSEWHENITATVFGNAGDEQDSAYPDIDFITGSTRGVALPFKWKTTPRPQVIVSGPRGEAIADIVDLGPWNLDDQDYVLGSARPMVEEQYDNGERAENGQVPTNDAAIDLTKPIADQIGISGKGKVKWRFA